ncbi:MAG: hypothetical protein WBL31_19180, partial [Ilumatobacteraceae bacterium]
ARALLLQGRLDEADELAADSDALAGQNLQTAIAARSAQAEILAVRGETVEALVLAEEAVRLAADTDIVLDHANALATLARVRAAHGDREGAQRAATSANDLFTLKGATVLVDSTRLVVDGPADTAPADEAAEPEPPASANRSDAVADEAWNRAHRWSLENLADLATGDPDRMTPRFHEHVTLIDHRSLVQHRVVGRDALLDSLGIGVGLFGGHFDITSTPVAVRGDLHLLRRVQWRSTEAGNDSLIEILEVHENTEDGQLIRISYREPSDLAGALAELDEWFFESTDPRDHLEAYSAATSDRTITARNSVAGLRSFHRDIVLRDHRAIGWGTLTGREAARERVESWSVMPDGFMAYTSRIHRSDRLWALQESRFRVDGSQGDESESGFLAVVRLEPGTGLVTNWEQFELDDVAAAVRRFDELVADDLQTRFNACVQSTAIISYIAHHRAVDHVGRLLADDFVADGVDLDGVSRDDITNGRVTPESIGFGVEYRTVVSVIGERLAMLFVEVESGERHWSVEETDEHGRLARIRHFPADALVEATNHLEERWQATEHAPPAVVTMNEWEITARRRQPDLMADLLAEGFELVDHRPLGLGVLDRAAMLEFNARADDDDLGELIPVQLHAASDRVVVVESAVIAPSDSDELWEAIVNTTVFVARDGLVERIELFDEGDLDGAMARAAEIDPEGFTTACLPVQRDDDHEPWNEADRLHRQLTRALEAGDVRGWRQLMADDVHVQDRRALLGHELSGVPGVETFYDDWQGGPHRCAVTTIASRGDDLVLLDMRWTPADDPDGPALEHLQICRWDSGRLVEAVTFDPGDLESAIDELDERYLDSIRVVDDPMSLTLAIANRASTRRDVEQMAAAFDRSIAMVDHRGIGWPSTVGREATSERLASLVGLPVGYLAYTSRTLASGTVSSITEQRMRVVGNEGGVQESVFVSASVRDPATSLMIRNEQFEMADLDAALARYDEILADHADPVDNDAVTAGSLANYCVRIGGFDHLHRVVADDFVAVGVGSGQQTVTLDDLSSGRVDPISVGYGVEYRHVISVVGDRLALLLVDTDSGRRWSVEELDESGRLRSVRHFPIGDLRAANAHFSDRWKQLEPVTSAVELLNRWLQAHFERDSATAAEILADDFTFVDHRMLGFGTVGKAELVGATAGGFDRGLGALTPLQRSTWVSSAARVSRFSERVVVATALTIATSDDGDLLEANPSVSVTEIRDGQIVRFELFPDDRNDLAMARASELDPEGFGADPARDSTDAHLAWNRADRLARLTVQRAAASQLEELAELFDESFQADDRRTFLATHYENTDEFMAGAKVVAEQTPGVSTRTETIATRGDDLVLMLTSWTDDEAPGGALIERLSITQWNDSDRLVRLVYFDPGDLRGALDELDRMFLATLDPITAGEYRNTFRFLNHLSDGELEPVMAVEHSDVRMVDHRPLGWGAEQDRDELRERFRTLTESDNSITEFVRRFHHRSPHVICIAIRIVNESPEGASFVDDHIVVSKMDRETGFGIRMDQFADEQLDEAMAFVDATTAEIDAEVPRANRAVRAGAVANLAATDGNLDDLLAILAGDFSAELADGRTVTVDDIRSGRVAPTEIGFGVTDRRTEDAFVDRIALLSVVLPDATRVWSIEYLDPTGRIAGVVQFPSHQPMVAQREYLVRARHLADDGPLPTLITFMIAAQDRDRDAIRDVLAPDFSFTDHRELGFGRADREAYVDLQATPPSDDPSLTTALRISQVEVLTDRLSVGRFKRVYLTPTGESWEAARGISVNLIRDGAQQVAELFDDDQLDAALARAAELDPDGFRHGGSLVSEDDHEPWNRADRLNRIACGHAFTGRFDEWAAMFADDYSGEQRRRLLGQDFTTKQDLVAANRAMMEASPTLVAEIETLATRGDHLVLTHLCVTPADDPGGSMIDVLDLTHWNDEDQCISTVTFDADDIVAAIDELDRRYLPECDPVLRLRLEWTRRIDEAIRDRDLDALVASVHPDLEWIDHRPLGWGLVSGQDGYRDRLSTLTSIDGALVRYMRRAVGISPTGTVIECRSQVTSPQGSVSIDDHLLVGMFDAGSGLSLRIEQFDREDERSAVERGGELAPVDMTAAVAVVGHANAASRMDVDDFRTFLADGFSAVGPRPDRATMTIADLRAGAVSPSDLGFGGHDREVIAVRGQCLVLVRVQPVDSSGIVHHWSLLEIDDDHRIVRLRMFGADQLRDAVGALEARALELADASAPPSAISRWNDAHRRVDAGALASLTADDFVFVDHRPRGYEHMGKEGALDLFRAGIDDDALGGVAVHGRVHTAGDSCWVADGALWMSRDDDYWIGNPFVAVMACRNGVVNRIEFFGEDDLDEALALAARLEAAFADSGQPERPSGWFSDGTIDPVWLAERSDVEVQSADLMLRFVDAVAVADADALDALLHPDFSTDDHRPVGWGPRSRETFLDAVRQRPTTLGTGVAHGEILLQLGPVGLCRYELTTATPDSGGEISEAGLGVMVVDDGRARRMELFGEADLAAAVVRTRELAELHPPTI